MEGAQRGTSMALPPQETDSINETSPRPEVEYS
jgi:hypothetical protein